MFTEQRIGDKKKKTIYIVVSKNILNKCYSAPKKSSNHTDTKNYYYYYHCSLLQ